MVLLLNQSINQAPTGNFTNLVRRDSKAAGIETGKLANAHVYRITTRWGEWVISNAFNVNYLLPA